MLERFEVQWRKVFVLTTRVGAAVLAFDFAEYANDRAWIDRHIPVAPFRLGRHCCGPKPLIEPSRQPVEIEKAAQTHSRIVSSRNLSHPTRIDATARVRQCSGMSPDRAAGVSRP
jgi:hypothetical protein